MKETVRLVQLYKVAAPNYVMGTCHIVDTEDNDRFECQIKGSKEHKEQLWQWISGKWDGLKCDIEFNEVTDRGIPEDAIITAVHGFDIVKF